ncbi:MAG: S8 family serine peptidase [Myxococcota bacterium]
MLALIGPLLWAALPTWGADSPGQAVTPQASTPRTAPAAPPALPRLGPRLQAALRRAESSLSVLAVDLEPSAPLLGPRLGRVSALRLSAADAQRLPGLVRYAELAPPHRPLLDQSRLAIGADATDRGAGFRAPHRGRGTVIGAYDSGIDLSHPDFTTIEGRLRVRGVWDQDAALECTTATLAASACPIPDATGHGTHVLSIAAGGGPRYRGIAPEAEILVARSTAYEGLLEALQWMEARATALQEPLVVNISLGGHVGPHDGTSPECLAIDDFRPLVVVAAGNEGNDSIHALAALRPGAPTDLGLDLPATSPEQHAIVDIWGAPTSSVTAELLLIDAGSVIWESGFIGVGAAGFDRHIDPAGRILGTVSLDAEASKNPLNGRPHLTVELSLPHFQGRAGFGLRLRGSGEVHLWIDTLATVAAPPSFSHTLALGTGGEIIGDSANSLSDLASASTAIAVSAWVARQAIPEIGASFEEQLHTIPAFSSYGPTLDPVRSGDKPDLAAPGMHVVAAARQQPPVLGLHVGSLYRVLSGTSMAVPHVAGAAAVLLEIDPKLDKTALRGLLLRTARPGDGDRRYGRGVLDLEAAAHAAAQDGGCGCAAAGLKGGSALWWWALLVWVTRLRRGARTCYP